MEFEYRLSNIDDAISFILEHAQSKTILFYGEMGAGKTTLIKNLVKKFKNRFIERKTHWFFTYI